MFIFVSILINKINIDMSKNACSSQVIKSLKLLKNSTMNKIIIDK